MSVSKEQLNEIHGQLRDYFLSHPAISIQATKGDPPEQYEITYNISGYHKPGKGEPSLSTGHRIELTIPFGFPHFPPSCKPKSDIFHPDFDPAAICLGDFWQQHTQIPDLILFIGKLINGESYSTTNAFNEEAASWYQSHSDLFPLAEIAWNDGENEFPTQFKASEPQLDTIDETDLTPDFSFLRVDEFVVDETPAPKAPSLPRSSPPTEDLSFLHFLESQKKYFEIRRDLESRTPFSDQVREISVKAEKEITKAEDLFRAAKRAENVGNLKNAARLYEEVGTIVSDYPKLDVVKKRINQSSTLAEEEPDDDVSDIEKLLSSFPLDGSAQAGNKQSPGPNKDKGTPSPSKEDDLPEIEERIRSKVTYLIPDNSVRNKITLYLIAGTVCVAFAVCVSYYFLTLHKFSKANASFLQCSTLLESERFDEAKLACDIALDALGSIKYVQQSRVKELINDTNKILASEKLKQGLTGNVLVDGKYLPKKDAAIIFSFKKLQEEGDSHFRAENWALAEERFTKALAIADKNPLFSAETIEELKSQLNFIRFSVVFSSANAKLASQKWQEAASEIKKAKTLLESLPEKDRQRYAIELSSALAKCNFEEFRKQGDDFFSKADWLSAISSYKAVLPTVEEGKVASQETLDALRENISRAELYATIDLGNKGFISGAWDDAIKEYTKAASILSSNQGTMKLADTQLTRKKIDRIILQTTIIRDRQSAKKQEEEKKDLPAARTTYKQIVANINNSGFASEEEFLDTKKTSLAAIEKLDERIYLADKEQYLKDNFRKLYMANYPSTIPENLNNPIITYVKEVDGKLIFKMQCTETGRGRPLNLVMYYAYDKAGNRWDFFSEQQ